jgi:hypothetical protein
MHKWTVLKLFVILLFSLYSLFFTFDILNSKYFANVDYPLHYSYPYPSSNYSYPAPTITSPTTKLFNKQLHDRFDKMYDEYIERHKITLKLEQQGIHSTSTTTISK